MRGPRRDEEASAQRDLDRLLRVRSVAIGSRRTAFEAVSAAATELKAAVARKRGGGGGGGVAVAAPHQPLLGEEDGLPDQKAEVQSLARRLAEAMERGDDAAASTALERFLRHPGGLDEGYVFGRTLLAEAVRFDCGEVVEALLEEGADPNATCSSGLAPLHLAAGAGKLSAMHALLLWGADPCLRDAAGFTPLQTAMLTAPNASLAQARELLLLSGGRESAADRRRMAARLLADENDAAYLARFRGDAAAPPAAGVASHIV